MSILKSFNIYFYADKCNEGVLSCPSGKHIVEKKINDCCKTRICECDVCPEVKTCQEGWLRVESEFTNECGCKTVECKPPTSCISNGEKYQPGKKFLFNFSC